MGYLRSGMWGTLDSVGEVKSTDDIIVNTRKATDVRNTFVATATPAQVVQAGLVGPISTLTIADLTVTNTSILADATSTSLSSGTVSTSTMTVTGTTTLNAALTGGIEATSGVISSYTLTSAGKDLLDDATAADQRTTLGLGALAVLNQVDTAEIVDSAVTEPKLSTAVADKINSTAKSNYVVVEVKADLPTPAAGVITLADNTTYEFNGDVSITTDRIEFGARSLIKGQGALATSITYTGTGAAITCTDQLSTLRDIRISCASGTAFEASGNTIQNLQIIDVDVDVASKIATFTNFGKINMTGCTFDSSADGIEFVGTGNSFTLNGHSILSNITNTYIDFGTAVIQEVTIDNVELATIGGSIGLSGNASTNIGNWGRISNCLFATTGTPLSGFDHTDTSWWFSNCINVQNSQYLGGLLMELNGTTTVITTVGVWVKVAGTTIAASTNQRVIMSGNNEFTMDTNGQTIAGTIHISFSCDDDASIEFYEFTVFKNAAKMSNVTIQLVANNLDYTGSLTVPELFADGDVYEFYVRNMSNTDNLTINCLQIQIRAG